MLPEVAQRLRVHRVTVARYIREGALPARRLGHRGPLRIEASAVERFLEHVQPKEVA